MNNFVNTPYGIQPSTAFMTFGPSLPQLQPVNMFTPDYGLQPRADYSYVAQQNAETSLLWSKTPTGQLGLPVPEFQPLNVMTPEYGLQPIADYSSVLKSNTEQYFQWMEK